MTVQADASWWQREWSIELSERSRKRLTCYSGYCFWHGDERPFRGVALSLDPPSLSLTRQFSQDHVPHDLLVLSFVVWEGAGLPASRDIQEFCRAMLDDEKIFSHGFIERVENEFSQNLLLSSFFRAHQPVQLSSVSIPKPWGKEVWYSGVEKRGVSKVRTAEQKLLELPYFEIFFGFALQQPCSALVLLKELKPFDMPFYGELYTELHTEKSEIYLVSELGPKVCPQGIGFVKLGLNENSSHTQLEELKETLLQYENLRAEIDQILEQKGHVFSSPTDLDELRAFDLKKRSLIAVQLLEAEQKLHGRVSAFFKYVPLRLGDVVNVPIHTPHALQPGVSVIEFQTPTYERKILASNQKVLTQESWDIEEAVALLQQNNASQTEVSQVLADQEIIAAFEDLFVVKLELNLFDSAFASLSTTLTPLVGMVVSGECQVRLLNSDEASAANFFAGNAFVLPPGDFLIEAVRLATDRCLLVLASSKRFVFSRSAALKKAERR